MRDVQGGGGNPGIFGFKIIEGGKFPPPIVPVSVLSVLKHLE